MMTMCDILIGTVLLFPNKPSRILWLPTVVRRQKVHSRFRGFYTNKKTVGFNFSLKLPMDLLIIPAVQLAHGAGLWVQELLLTPSELRDTVSQSRQGRILAKIPMKLHWDQTVDFEEKSRVFNFKSLYLRAQMELERVLWLKVRLHELVRPLGWSVDP